MSTAKSVELSTVALQRIVKHIPQPGGLVASGCLLGLDTAAGAVEVTNVFLHPAKGAADFQPTEDDAAGEYQGECLKLLKAANLDANIVGWFQSSLLSSFVNEATVEIQYDYQTQNPNSVLIVAEPGNTLIRAFQLSPEYMLFHKAMRERRAQGPATLITGGPVKFNTATQSVFTPVSVAITLSVLDEAFLLEQRSLIDTTDCVATDKTALLTSLAETIEDLAIEHVRFTQLAGNTAATTRIRGEDESKRIQSANDYILLTENAKWLCR